MIKFPDDKTFAFTILDDTDDATLENVKPVYDLLQELGMKTTKTAWPMSCPEGSKLFFAGETLQDHAYLEFVKSLVNNGYELASHCATMESSQRDRTKKGLAFMESEFNCDLTLHCNHGHNLENIYWGSSRYQILPVCLAFGVLKRFKRSKDYMGQVEGTPDFWGDICRERFKYVRNFSFEQLDISNIPPGYPYRLKSTPYVNYWFSTADASDVYKFRKLVTREKVDAMARNGGFTIISTHLGKGFVRNGIVDDHVKEVLSYISKKPGWFVPVSRLLDYLLRDIEKPQLSMADMYRLELMHIGDRIVQKVSNKLRKVF